MPRLLWLRRLALLSCAVIASVGSMRSTLGQFVIAPKGTGLVIDNVVEPPAAKVVMNMDHDALSDKLPTGLYYMELILSHYGRTESGVQMVALFHDKGGYMILNDDAFNRFRHTGTGNPWKAKIADLQKAGVAFELCSFTAYNNGWVNADLLPGVKVDNDVLLRLISLSQQGYVQIQP